MSSPDLPLAPATVGDAPLWDIFLSAFHTAALVIADDVGLFAALAETPASAAELAPRLGLELRAVETLVGVISALGLCTMAGGRCHLSEVARTYLLPGRPYY